ncbi:sirohydrochlorin chelatase [Leifsonia sp. AG29]|uniref:sirohydrochlorin chelatase n=1 Tax=Leifsonia sp. AG29 TaxID=2598860 RepID=UPI00131B8534|nr:CbiX/SirB N-terminal domain-containing protein [Leifsonia sp. AG29]
MIALLTVSHGTSDPVGQRAVADFAAAVHGQIGADLAAHAFVDVQQPDLAEALGALPADASVIVLPLLLSRGYHLGHDIPEAVAPFGDRVVVAGALGPDVRLGALLRRRILEAGATPADSIVLAVAGSSDADGVDDGREAGLLLCQTAGRSVTVGFLSAAEPNLPTAVARSASSSGGARVVAASYLLAPGYFQDLVHKSGADLVTEPLLRAGREPEWELVAVARDRYSAALSSLTASDADRPRRTSETTDTATP